MGYAGGGGDLQHLQPRSNLAGYRVDLSGDWCGGRRGQIDE